MCVTLALSLANRLRKLLCRKEYQTIYSIEHSVHERIMTKIVIQPPWLSGTASHS